MLSWIVSNVEHCQKNQFEVHETTLKVLISFIFGQVLSVFVADYSPEMVCLHFSFYYS